jgi:branched-chain amino acid transport system substrate-binding protein
VTGSARRGVVVAALCAVLAACLIGCGGGDDKTAPTVSLTVYSSMPLRGPDALHGREIVEGEKLALSDSGGIVNGFRVKYVSLDDSGEPGAAWRPDAVAANARQAVQDRSTIAYLGDFASGASAVSAPITNSAGILQVSPASTYGGLTRADGGDKGEPEKYSPSGKLTFGRIIPNDVVQAAALVELVKGQHARNIVVLQDRTVYGFVLAREVTRRATDAGLNVAIDGVDMDADPVGEAAKVTQVAPDAIVLTASSPTGAPALLRALHSAAPDAALIGSAALAVPAVTSALGSAAGATLLASPDLPLDKQPAQARSVARRFRAAVGRAASGSSVLLGYEGMQSVLAAIDAAGKGGNDRRRVIDGFFGLKHRHSVLGTYGIDARGDTTLTRYGAYRVRAGRLAFLRVLDAGGG